MLAGDPVQNCEENMSMIGNLSRIPEDVRVALHENPKAINEVLYPDFDDVPVKKAGLLARLFGKKNELAPSKEQSLHTLQEEDTTDVDKTWHALHFLFTGSDWDGSFPEGFLVSCGEPVGNVDVGYGPAKSFTSIQVKEIAGFLSGLERADLMNRFDPEKMHELEIYPSIWDNSENPEEDWEYVEGGLDEIIRFVGETAERNMALLIHIN